MAAAVVFGPDRFLLGLSAVVLLSGLAISHDLVRLYLPEPTDAFAAFDVFDGPDQQVWLK